MNPPRPTARTPVRQDLRTAAALGLLAALGVFWASAAGASGDRYRVELIVFRNLDVPATPVELGTVRRFRSALDLDEEQAPEVPVRLEKRDGAFANLWSRLDRLAEYEPLLRLTFEQSLYDYHPPVRVHDEVVMGQALLGGEDAAGGTAETAPEAEVALLYRLDGTVQLRRSRFLHVDLDLEYRLDGPAWEQAFPAQLPPRLPDGFEWLGGPPPASTTAGAAAATGAIDTPFRLHRLQQSRQVRTDTMQYFDSAFLGAIVRVTTIADPP